jgi:hypothetical protein
MTEHYISGMRSSESQPKPQQERHVSEIIVGVNKLLGMAVQTAKQLHETRLRLTGVADPPPNPNANTKGEVLGGGQLSELRHALNEVQRTLDDIARFSESLAGL